MKCDDRGLFWDCRLCGQWGLCADPLRGFLEWIEHHRTHRREGT